MKRLDFGRYALSSCAVLALLEGCGGSQPPIGVPGAIPQSRTQAQDTSVPDGFGPSSRLVVLNGKLYGTTSGGGANSEGTVYRITTSGAENVVYSFAPGCRRNRKCPDGWIPLDLARVSRTLYGATLNGGRGHCPKGCGAVFSVTPSGEETVLHSFESKCRRGGPCSDAHFPTGLTAIDRTLYGTSYFGGTYGSGTVYSVTTSGVEKVVYSFAGGSSGSWPTGGVINVNGTLYGTTLHGGAYGAGFVFSLSETGSMNVLYSFGVPKGNGGSAGANGNLIYVHGVLYGTTYVGGPYQKGTVFSITTDGTVTVLHSFGAGCHSEKQCPDGEYPDSGLLDVNGVLYGLTKSGGTRASGTLFSITTSGSEKRLHSFSRGHVPAAGLTELNGILYGITGGGTCGGGTVFGVTLSGKATLLHTFC